MSSTAQFWFDELEDVQDEDAFEEMSFIKHTRRKSLDDGKQDTKRYRHIKDKRRNRIREDEIAV